MSKILIVEDEKNIRLSINMLLKEKGYEVYEVDNGIDAIKAAQEKMPDLVLLDILIPKMDGYMVCEALKKNPQTKKIPVIFMSARTQEKDLNQARVAGGNDFIMKPFKSEELLSCVKKNIGRNEK